MSTILCTGAAGFIGSNFVRTLAARHAFDEILVLDALTYAANPINIADLLGDDSRITFHHGSVTNPEIVDDLVHRADVIVHFAAETHVARSIYQNRVFIETDVLGTQVLCSSILRHRRRVRLFVHISSSEVYGSALQRPMDENHPLNPTSPYAAAKAGADRLVHSYVATYGLPGVIVRPFNQYGPRQHLEKAVPRFVTAAILDEPIVIHGSGAARRDWVYVMDTCQALEKIIDADPAPLIGRVINLASGRAVSVLDVARQILSEFPNAAERPMQHGPDRPGQVDWHEGSTELARSLLGWQASTPLEEGLKATVKWYRENRDHWIRQLWMREVWIDHPELGRSKY